jgi:hypothetical protein
LVRAALYDGGMNEPIPKRRRQWPFVLGIITAVVTVIGGFDNQKRQTQALDLKVQELQKSVDSLKRELGSYRANR